MIRRSGPHRRHRSSRRPRRPSPIGARHLARTAAILTGKVLEGCARRHDLLRPGGAAPLATKSPARGGLEPSWWPRPPGCCTTHRSAVAATALEAPASLHCSHPLRRGEACSLHSWYCSLQSPHRPPARQLSFPARCGDSMEKGEKEGERQGNVWLWLAGSEG
jgi:hypothetical protein